MAAAVAASSFDNRSDPDGGVRLDFLNHFLQNTAAVDANSKKVTWDTMKRPNRPFDPTITPFFPRQLCDADIRRPIGMLPGSRSVPSGLGDLHSDSKVRVQLDSQSSQEDSNSVYSGVSQSKMASSAYTFANGHIYSPAAQNAQPQPQPQPQQNQQQQLEHQQLALMASPVPYHLQQYQQVQQPQQQLEPEEHAASTYPYLPDVATSSAYHQGGSETASVTFPSNQPLTQQPLLHNPIVDVIPDHIRAQRSQALNQLTSGPTGRPTLAQALDSSNFPFAETARVMTPDACTNGVVKLKNIPFATRRAEIIAFLGRNSKILNDNLEPVHIIMERVTSKTMDAYVEFLTLQDAMKAVDKHQATLARGRLSRLGDRPIEVELSSQATLMKDLFPSARGVFWEGVRPTVKAFKPNEPWENFKGFINDEEMTMLVKHVEVPQRSPFSRDCPQRPYECMISTLRKLPWPMTELITLRQRHAIYNACLTLLRLLGSAVAARRHEEVLGEPLRRRLVHAAMTCPGFTVVQKDNVATLVDMPAARRLEYGLPRFAGSWTHLYALSPKANFPLDVIEYYVAVIREETGRVVDTLPIEERSLAHRYGRETDLYFGYLWRELQLPRDDRFDSMTLAEAATLEYATIERILCRAFGTGYPAMGA